MLPADNKAAFATALQAERFPGQTGTPIEIIIKDGANKIEEINTYTSKLDRYQELLRCFRLKQLVMMFE
jgi:RND superfamily putative drug exporter